MHDFQVTCCRDQYTPCHSALNSSLFWAGCKGCIFQGNEGHPCSKWVRKITRRSHGGTKQSKCDNWQRLAQWQSNRVDTRRSHNSWKKMTSLLLFILHNIQDFEFMYRIGDGWMRNVWNWTDYEFSYRGWTIHIWKRVHCTSPLHRPALRFQDQQEPQELFTLWISSQLCKKVTHLW